MIGELCGRSFLVCGRWGCLLMCCVGGRCRENEGRRGEGGVCRRLRGI